MNATEGCVHIRDSLPSVRALDRPSRTRVLRSVATSRVLRQMWINRYETDHYRVPSKLGNQGWVGVTGYHRIIKSMQRVQLRGVYLTILRLNFK
jgi:hypothetical protein